MRTPSATPPPPILSSTSAAQGGRVPYASESAGVDGLFPLDAMVPYYTGEYAEGEIDEGDEAKRARI